MTEILFTAYLRQHGQTVGMLAYPHPEVVGSMMHKLMWGGPNVFWRNEITGEMPPFR